MFTERAVGSSYGMSNNAIGNMATQSALGFNQFKVNEVSGIYNTCGSLGYQDATSRRSSSSSSGSSYTSEEYTSEEYTSEEYTSEEYTSEEYTNEQYTNEQYTNEQYTIQASFSWVSILKNNIEQPQQKSQDAVTLDHLSRPNQCENIPVAESGPKSHFTGKLKSIPCENIPVAESGSKSHFIDKLKSIFCCLVPHLAPRKLSR